MWTRPVKVRSTRTFWPRVMFTASTPAFAGTSRAVKKYLPARTPLPASPVTSLGTTRSASGADSRALARRDVLARELDAGPDRVAPAGVGLRRRDLSVRSDEGDRRPFSAGTTAPRKAARRSYLAGFGPASVSPYAVIAAVCVAVSPVADCAVRVAVQRPAAYVCSAVRPSAEVPSPKSQRYDAASPVAAKVTCNGVCPGRRRCLNGNQGRRPRRGRDEDQKGDSTGQTAAHAPRISA